MKRSAKRDLLKYLSLPLLCLALTACQKGAFHPVSPELRNPGTTGYTNLNGSDYTVGDDEERVLEATEELAPENVEQISEEEALRLQLAQSITAGRILRYNSEGKTARYGETRVRIILQITDEGANAKEYSFEAPLNFDGTHLSFDKVSSSSASEYELRGSFTDTPSTDSSTGKLFLSRKKQNASPDTESQILIQSYLGELRIRTRRGEAPSERLQQQLESLKSYPYAWVNNFVVVMGRSFFDYMLIRQQQLLGEEASLNFSGESVRTTQEQTPVQQIQGPQAPTQIRLVGDGEENNMRTFEFSFDSETEDTEEIMVDIDSTHTLAVMPESQGPLYDPDQPEDDSPPSSLPQQPTRPMEIPTRPSSQNQQSPLGPSGSAFLPDRSGIARVQAIHSDLSLNLNAPEVREWIAAIKGQGSAPKYRSGSVDRNDYPRRFQRFLSRANPFRTLLRDIFNHYGLPSSIAYLTINESNFFIEGDYPVQSNSESTAFGPFQFLKGTAGTPVVNMKVDMSQSKGQTPPSWDERHYFAPSACGAAAYFHYLTKLFEDGDQTLALLAYGIGEGAAAAVIECHEGSSSANQAQCEKSLYRFKGSDYDKFIRNLNSYDYSFTEVSRRNFVPETFVRWVRKWLAYYAIGQNLGAHGMSIPSDANQQMPAGKVFPSGGVNSIKSPTCKQALANF